MHTHTFKEHRLILRDGRRAVRRSTRQQLQQSSTVQSQPEQKPVGVEFKEQVKQLEEKKSVLNQKKEQLLTRIRAIQSTSNDKAGWDTFINTLNSRFEAVNLQLEQANAPKELQAKAQRILDAFEQTIKPYEPVVTNVKVQQSQPVQATEPESDTIQPKEVMPTQSDTTEIVENTVEQEAFIIRQSELVAKRAELLDTLDYFIAVKPSNAKNIQAFKQRFSAETQLVLSQSFENLQTSAESFLQQQTQELAKFEAGLTKYEQDYYQDVRPKEYSRPEMNENADVEKFEQYIQKKYNVQLSIAQGFNTVDEVSPVYTKIEDYLAGLHKDPKQNWQQIAALQNRKVYADNYNLPGLAEGNLGTNVFVNDSNIESTLNESSTALAKKTKAERTLNQISNAFGLKRLYLERSKIIRKGRSLESESNYDQYDEMHSQLENVRQGLALLTPEERKTLEYIKIYFATSNLRNSGYIQPENRIFVRLTGQPAEQIATTIKAAIAEMENSK